MTKDNNTRKIAEALQQGQFKRAASKAIEWIQKDPRSAQGWTFLGEAYLHQGHAATARKAFERAALLDPDAPWIDAIWAILANAHAGEEDPDINRLLETRKVSVAAAIMTKNEERSIRRCILSLLDAVDEIIVLDSSSTDQTVAIAKQFPQVKVIENVCLDDDFAAKRNKGLEHIDSDWVLWVDADEWLHAEDKAAVRTAAALFHDAAVPPVLNITVINHIGGRKIEEASLSRMFPLSRGLRYYGRVHEQIIREGHDIFTSDILFHPIRIRLHHDGYQPAFVQSKDKINRNIRLLERMIEEDPNNPGWWLYYGRETLGSGDLDRALERLLEAERKAIDEPRFGRLVEIHLLLVRIYISRQQYDEAEAVCLRSLEARPDFPNMHYELAQIRMRKAAQLLQQAETNLKQSKQTFQTYRGGVPADREIREWKADVALADLARLAGHATQAETIYEAVLAKRPDLDIVREKLEKVKKKDPDRV